MVDTRGSGERQGVCAISPASVPMTTLRRRQREIRDDLQHTTPTIVLSILAAQYIGHWIWLKKGSF